MKNFAIVQHRNGIHIQRNAPRHIIIAEADTYELAVVIRDRLRDAEQKRKSKATEDWFTKWNRAEERGNMQELLHLGHADKY